MRPHHFIAKDTEREVVFRTPFWGRLALAPFALLFWGCLSLFVQACGYPRNTGDWYVDGLVVLLLGAMALLLTYVCLPHELRLNFVRREFEQTVGVFSLVLRRVGSFDDIRSVFVAEANNSIYRIGLIWQGRRAAQRLLIDDGHYRFAVSIDRAEAEAFAEKMAVRLGVPYEGLIPRYRSV